MVSITAVATRAGVNPKEVKRFLKFVVVGSIGFIVDSGLLTMLVEIFGKVATNANVFSFSAAVISNFILNRYWTYPDSRSKPLWSQLTQFALINSIGFAINQSIFVLLQPIFNEFFVQLDWRILIERGYIPAKIGATVVVLFWNFFVNRYWTYNDID